MWRLGGSSKRSFISNDLVSIKLDWVALQKTKLGYIDNCLVRQICGHRSWGYVYSASTKMAGGILCCWDKPVFEALVCVIEK